MNGVKIMAISIWLSHVLGGNVADFVSNTLKLKGVENKRVGKGRIISGLALASFTVSGKNPIEVANDALG